MEEAQVKQIKLDILRLDLRNQYWFLKLLVILNGIHSWDSDLKWNKIHWENNWWTSTNKIKPEFIIYNVPFPGNKFSLCCSLAGYHNPLFMCSFIHLIHTVDFILLIQKILMVLIAVVFIVNMKIIIEVQNIKGSVVAIVKDTIMNIPLKNLLQRYRKHIHEHNAQIFKK